jgi:hypothetical protein
MTEDLAHLDFLLSASDSDSRTGVRIHYAPLAVEQKREKTPRRAQTRISAKSDGSISDGIPCPITLFSGGPVGIAPNGRLSKRFGRASARTNRSAAERRKSRSKDESAHRAPRRHFPWTGLLGAGLFRAYHDNRRGHGWRRRLTQKPSTIFI